MASRCSPPPPAPSSFRRRVPRCRRSRSRQRAPTCSRGRSWSRAMRRATCGCGASRRARSRAAGRKRYSARRRSGPPSIGPSTSRSAIASSRMRSTFSTVPTRRVKRPTSCASPTFSSAPLSRRARRTTWRPLCPRRRARPPSCASGPTPTLARCVPLSRCRSRRAPCAARATGCSPPRTGTRLLSAQHAYTPLAPHYAPLRLSSAAGPLSRHQVLSQGGADLLSVEADGRRHAGAHAHGGGQDGQVVHG